MLEYTLEANELTANPNDLRAQVVNVSSYSQADLVDRIMKIGAGLTRSDIISVLEAEKQVVADVVAEGGAVTTELFNAFPSISGVFDSPDAPFDPAKHKAHIKLHPGIALRNAVADIKTKRVAAVVTGTVITAVTDLKTGAINETLTPGRDMKVSGVKLRIAGTDPAVGLYFVPAAGDAVKADISDVVVNNPSELIALVPALPAGTYRVRIATQYTSGKLLKAPHTFTFDKELTVTSPA
ncbi:MAG: DUF4469 domain-containing protein [Treponema sp.]|jgi:hypothetical protein|nr:DUF4469 domain-containing protein [Treponema sp.]